VKVGKMPKEELFIFSEELFISAMGSRAFVSLKAG
jgi:hypothetical protein